MLGELGNIQQLPPYASVVVMLKAEVLLSLHCPREALHIIEASPFRSASAELRLSYARALEFSGFFLESIAVAPPAHTVEENAPLLFSSESERNTARQKLVNHARHLAALFEQKAHAEDALVVSKYVDAQESFTEALAMAKPESWKLRAALLLGRANAVLSTERLLSARNDLCESLRLDPSNQITRMRLRTVELSLDAQQFCRPLQR